MPARCWSVSLNTLLVSGLGIVFATLLGLAVGVGAALEQLAR